jgi:hypothetical protein
MSPVLTPASVPVLHTEGGVATITLNRPAQRNRLENADLRALMAHFDAVNRDPEVRVRLPEFLAATADPRRHVMLEALDPEYFYGGAAFFDRGGHVPHATLMPAGDFYNAAEATAVEVATKICSRRGRSWFARGSI